MSDWKESSLRKKNYRRGGIEPDPPRVRHKKRFKPFVVQSKLNKSTSSRSPFFSLFGKRGWITHGRYRTIGDAMNAVRDNIRNESKYLKYDYRIITGKSSERKVVWEQP